MNLSNLNRYYPSIGSVEGFEQTETEFGPLGPEKRIIVCQFISLLSAFRNHHGYSAEGEYTKLKNTNQNSFGIVSKTTLKKKIKKRGEKMSECFVNPSHIITNKNKEVTKN
jgi:hypothetical protein